MRARRSNPSLPRLVAGLALAVLAALSSAPVAVAAARDAHTRVEEVRFVLFGRPAFEAFERALDESSPRSAAPPSVRPAPHW